MRAAKHRLLVDREIDHAVRDDDVEAFRCKIELIELLDIALEEAHVAARIAEALLLPGKMVVGGGELLIRHVDADDLAGAAYELCQNIGVAPRA